MTDELRRTVRDALAKGEYGRHYPEWLAALCDALDAAERQVSVMRDARQVAERHRDDWRGIAEVGGAEIERLAGKLAEQARAPGEQIG